MLSTLSREQLKRALDSRGIEYRKNASVEKLSELLRAATVDTSPADEVGDESEASEDAVESDPTEASIRPDSGRAEVFDRALEAAESVDDDEFEAEAPADPEPVVLVTAAGLPRVNVDYGVGVLHRGPDGKYVPKPSFAGTTCVHCGWMANERKYHPACHGPENLVSGSNG